MEVDHEENQAHARTDSSQTQRSRSTAGGEHATGRSDAITWCFTPDLSALAQPIRRHEPDDVARLKTLEKENARLKRLLAEKELDNDMTPCSPRENGDPESKASGRCAPRGRIRGFAAERVWWSTNTAVLNVTAPPAATKNRPYESASGPWRSNTPATATRAST